MLRRRLTLLLAIALCVILVCPAAAQTSNLVQPQRPDTIDLGPTARKPRTDLLGAIGDSMKLLMIEHGTRLIFQEKTRQALTEGSFFEDYRRSVRWPQHWEDGDSWWTNYIGHPLHGAAAGMIFIDHGPQRAAPMSLKLSYWNSRARATAFSALYSVQFEFGPLSEASIGNVGMDPATAGWVDHAVTPAGAFVLMVAEDALDHFFIAWVEQHVSNIVARASLRMLFNPSRTFANIAQSRAPWSRPDRSLRWAEIRR